MNERNVRSFLNRMICDSINDLNWLFLRVTAGIIIGAFLLIFGGYTTVPEAEANVTQAISDVNTIFQNILDDWFSVTINWVFLVFVGVLVLIAVTVTVINRRRQRAYQSYLESLPSQPQPTGAINLASAQPGSETSKEQQSS